MNLTKKMGPLPVWAWGLILGVVGYYVYSRYEANASTSSTTTSPTVLDPNSIDPNTGLTYGQEEDDALNANAAAAAQPSATPTTSDLQTGTSELQDLDGFLQGFGTIASDLGYVAPGSQGAGSAAATTSPPMQAQASPPTINVSVNTNPAVAPTPAQTTTMVKQATTALKNKKVTVKK